MSDIKAVLWDVDGTLLDFLAAEREGSIGIFEHFIPDPKPISKR